MILRVLPMGRRHNSCLAGSATRSSSGGRTLRQLPLGLSGNFSVLPCRLTLRHQQGEINLHRRVKPSISSSSQATVSPVPTPTSSGPTKPEAATAAGATAADATAAGAAAAGAAALAEEELAVGTEAEPTERNNPASGTLAPNVVVPVENGGSSNAAKGGGGAVESAEGGQGVSAEPLKETLNEGLGVAETAAAETRSDGSEEEEAEETDLDNDR